jgi:hypothetical protein
MTPIPLMAFTPRWAEDATNSWCSNPSVNRTEFPRQFNYFAVQMTTFRTVQNQRVTNGA